MANEAKASRYQRLQRRASIAATFAGAVLLLIFQVTGASAALRDAVLRVTAGAHLAVAGYVTALFVLYELVQLPFVFYQCVVLERRYDLSTERRAHWWLTQAKATAVGLAFAVTL